MNMEIHRVKSIKLGKIKRFTLAAHPSGGFLYRELDIKTDTGSMTIGLYSYDEKTLKVN